MHWIRAIILAFSTYSRIPAPKVKWDDDAMTLAIAFLPLVGAVIGVAVWCWLKICGLLNLSPVLFAAVAIALPVAITGGIHLDGYCDTSDALSSWQDKERALEILKDPRIGAFALIRSNIYLLLCFALFYELYQHGIGAGIIFLYPLSRCFAAWSALTMPSAKRDGMLAAFTKKADRRAVGLTLAVLTIIAAAGWICPAFPQGLGGIALCLPVTLWYRATAIKRFGGVTGDTTGFYLQTIELALLAGLLAGEILTAWL